MEREGAKSTCGEWLGTQEINGCREGSYTAKAVLLPHLEAVVVKLGR